MNALTLFCRLLRQKRNCRLSKAALRAMQEKKLRALLHYANQHSPYYREAFRRAGISEAALDTLPLSAFPTLDKQTLLENFGRIVTVPLTAEELARHDAATKADRAPYRGRYHIVHSSGSTGKPGFFVYDTKAWNAMLAGILRAALWDLSLPQMAKLLLRRPHILYIAATDGHYGGAMAVGDGIDGVGARQLHLDIKTPLAQWLPLVKAFRPDILIGYPSAIKILGEQVQAEGLRLRLSRVISCGEPLDAGLRRFFEQTFQTRVLNFYGASEALALGVELNPAEGMLLFDDMNVFEVENGALYVTSLYNFAQPLIRYRLSDRLELHEAPDGAACPFTRAVGLIGRSEDVLWFESADGRRDFLHPLAIEGICIEGLRDVQFCQTAPDAFCIFTQLTPSAEEASVHRQIRELVCGVLHEKGLNFVQFTITTVAQIAPAPLTGKKPLILREPYREAQDA